MFKDAFKYVDTHGLPLSLVMTETNKRGIPTDLRQFIKDAVNAGWSHEKAIATANEAVNVLRGTHCKFVF